MTKLKLGLKRSRAFIGVLLILFMGVGIGRAEEVRLTFLHTNDMGEISGKSGFGGFPELSTLIQMERERSPNSLTTFGGDLISPSLMSGLSHGVEMIEMLNLLKVDVAVIGNHEFDFGPDVTRDRLKEAKFPWLASNVSVAAGVEALGNQEMMIQDMGGFKVGVFGLTTPDTVYLSSPGKAVAFEDIIPAAERMVAKLKAEGADIVIALTHMALSDDLRLAEEVDGIDVLLGGHDHKAFATKEKNTVILQAGSDLRYLGVVDLLVERKEKRGKPYLSIVPSWKLIATTSINPDADVGSVVASYQKELDAKLEIPVGPTEIDLDTRRTTVRTKSTDFGVLIAHAMKEEVDADIGFTNGGGIRGDREYAAGTVLTRKDILTELPFGNVTVKLEISGKALKDLVEHSVSKVEEGAGRFGQFSGLEYSYDVSKPSGSRVTSVQVAGKQIDPAATYTIATNDYVAGGGDGYAMLKASKVLIDKAAGELMASTVMNFIEKKGGVKPGFAN
ncbi:bifunctional metallophosphatase/5'-nucleotidase [Sneathiella limimaris]|uniref:bifunctional metallophosphatase/5'-nucleotidase n=1 Tax=Sneathiella limimaris TaxID=1964213 RepID=UPI00146E8352|nr:bifunctional UDP-sugar hydrolase/5'-nucleotidase [Sneathiella limimaris]